MVIRNQETAAAGRRTHQLIAETFQGYAEGLATPVPELIRAGRAGGLAFDSLTTDVCVGCLPTTHVCYGSCFAARESYRLGVDFGIRVENRLDEALFRADLESLPARQQYLRSGWHSDPSWRWALAARVAELIHEAGRHTVLVTKCFTAMTPEVMARFVAVNAELRVSLSAMDTDAQLQHRLLTAVTYRDAGGLALPVVVSAKFVDPVMNEKQDSIVRLLVEHDIPGSENSLRFDPSTPVARLFDRALSRLEEGTTDQWCGRLYERDLPVPTITSVPDDYRGLPDRFRSRNDDGFLRALFADPVPTQEQVLSSGPLHRPKQAAVAKPERPMELVKAAGR